MNMICSMMMWLPSFITGTRISSVYWPVTSCRQMLTYSTAWYATVCILTRQLFASLSEHIHKACAVLFTFSM